MALRNRLAKNILGAFAGLAIVGLIGSCAYMAMYIGVNCPYQLYQYGRLGVLAVLAYVICVLSIVALAVYLVALFFILCDCCECFKKTLAIIGTIIWVACFICECMFVAWNNWNLTTKVWEESNSTSIKEYSAAFMEKPQYAYYIPDDDYIIPGLNNLDQGLPPTFGAGFAKIQEEDEEKIKFISLPVCYFATDDDKKAYNPVRCSGHWNGERIKAYFTKLAERAADAVERQSWDLDRQAKYNFHFDLLHRVMYTNTGAYGIFPIFLGIQIGALVFGVIYTLIAWCECCCGNKQVSNVEP